MTTNVKEKLYAYADLKAEEMMQAIATHDKDGNKFDWADLRIIRNKAHPFSVKEEDNLYGQGKLDMLGYTEIEGKLRKVFRETADDHMNASWPPGEDIQDTLRPSWVYAEPHNAPTEQVAVFGRGVTLVLRIN